MRVVVPLARPGLATVGVLPPLVVFILVQRQVIAGLTTGGTEG
jgi:ABC-type glycerol-3-phosphate transport system permease component